MTLKEQKYPAHGLLQQAVSLPVGYKATIFDSGNKGNIDDRVVVTYKDLIAEFTALQSKLNIAVEALEKMKAHEGQYYCTEPKWYFTTKIAEDALKLINGEG